MAKRCAYREGDIECRLSAAKRSSKGYCNKHVKRKGFPTDFPPNERRRNLGRHVPRLLKDSDNRCDLCGRKIKRRHDVEVDHAHPRKRGGSNFYDNLLVAHALCNMVKNSLSMTDPKLWQLIGAIDYKDHFKDGKSKERLLEPSAEREVCRRYGDGENCLALGEAFGTSESTIINILKRHGVERRTPRENNDGLTDEQEAEVCQRYEAGEKQTELADAFGLVHGTIGSILKRNRVEIRPPKVEHGGLSEAQETEVCRRYEDGKTLVELAEDYDVSLSTLSYILKRGGVETRRNKRQSDERELAICRRYSEGETLVELGQAFGISFGTVGKILARRGVKARSQSEAQKLSNAKRRFAHANPTQKKGRFRALSPVAA